MASWRTLVILTPLKVLALRTLVPDGVPFRATVTAAVERYVREHDDPDGFTWADIDRVPDRYWTEMGLRGTEVMLAETQDGDLVLQEPEERILPESPEAAGVVVPLAVHGDADALSETPDGPADPGVGEGS